MTDVTGLAWPLALAWIILDPFRLIEKSLHKWEDTE